MALIVMLSLSSILSAQITIFEEDFETSNLTTRGWIGDLNRHDRWGTEEKSPYQGKRAANYDCYVSGTKGDMISPTINLSGTTNNILSFWIKQKKYDGWFNDYWNHCYVYVSNDNGNNWILLEHMQEIPSYVQKSYNLDNYITPTSQVKIKFVGQGGNADDNSYDTFIDNVKITGESNSTPEPSRLDILKHWAPQVFQDVRSDNVLGHQYYEAQDFIVKVNFDNNWYAGDQNENSQLNGGNYPGMEGHCYAHFVETETHFFLKYNYYHTMDDAVISADRHENDQESVYMCIKKTDSSYGQFRCMKTTYHSEGKTYGNGGDLTFDGFHPRIYISSNGDVINSCVSTGAHGHGIEAYVPGTHCTGDDAIVYNIADVAEIPTETGGGAFNHHYNYSLIDVDEFWNRRFNYDNHPFDGYGSFGGDGDEPSGGNIGLNMNSATEFANQFSWLTTEGDYSYTYLFNPYSPDGGVVASHQDDWTGKDIGSPAKEGYSWSYRDVFTISGGGSDIWNTSDQFHYVYKQLSGDGEIVARVYSLQEDINSWSKAGVMIRESLNANSKFAMMVVTPDNGASFQYRTSTGSSCGHSAQSGLKAPLWVKVKRSGSTLTGYYSTDGSSWTQKGSISISMSSSLYIGLSVTSHNVNYLCSATFDNLSVSGNVLKNATIFNSDDNILNISKDYKFKLYSKDGILYIKSNQNDSEELSVVVFDVMGRKVLEQPLELSLNKYYLNKKGVYVINIIKENQVVHRDKIVIR